MYLHLYLTSLHKRVVSLESWIQQVMVWSIITWEIYTQIPTHWPRQTTDPLDKSCTHSRHKCFCYISCYNDIQLAGTDRTTLTPLAVDQFPADVPGTIFSVQYFSTFSLWKKKTVKKNQKKVKTYVNVCKKFPYKNGTDVKVFICWWWFSLWLFR